MNNRLTRNILYALLPVALFVATWLMWARWCPELMNYHEQYQLFLFNGTYFTQDISVPGGFADYVSEFLTQFYYVPWLGALVIASVITLLQILTGILSLRACKSAAFKPIAWGLSVAPSLGVLYCMGDENVLLSFPVALVMMCLVTLAMWWLNRSPLWAFGATLAIGYAIVYWLIGPVAVLYLLLSVGLRQDLPRRWAWFLGALFFGWIWIKLLAVTILTQFPESQLYLGINYYRIENTHPTALLVTCLIALAVVLWPNIEIKTESKAILGLSYVALIAVIIGGAFTVRSGYNDQMLDIIRFDSMVRHEKWLDIIELAQKRKPDNEMSSQALNLALAKTGQLGDRLFEFPQKGIGSLLSKYYRNNTTCLISAEAFYHLGMVNTAFRYNFDLQESIINNRKSGRFMKRLAECLIINGKYKAAKKYVNMLKHSLYYSQWANEAEALMTAEAAIDHHPDYGEKRRLRFKQEMLFDYTQIERMLGLLAIESNGQNRLAWDYFVAGMLLKGDLQTLTGIYHYADEMYPQPQTPRSHQEALSLFWVLGHKSFQGIPYHIDDNVKQQVVTFCQEMSKNKSNNNAWISRYGNTFWAYLWKQRQNKAQAEQSSSTEREG